MVARRIGTNDFLAAIEHAIHADNFKRALLPPKPPPTVTRATVAALLAESTSPSGSEATGTTPNKDFNAYDYSTAHFIQRFESEVRKAIVRLYGGESTKDSNANGSDGINGTKISPFDLQEGEDTEASRKD